MTDMERYCRACEFKGEIDETAVEASLSEYVAALGIQRQVKRITRPWWTDVDLLGYTIAIARAALAALDARDARDARDGAILLREFGNWCITRAAWWTWDIPWLASIYFGGGTAIRWSKPVYNAFCAGVWTLFWTQETLYWMAWPSIQTIGDGSRRVLHNDHGPACTNDVENLYFLNGILVPAYAVVSPQDIALAEIEAENNNDVRAVLTERFGWPRYLKESGAKQVNARVHPREGTEETLYVDRRGMRRLVVIDPATDGPVALGVPREIETCEQAQNWLSHGADALAMCRT